MEKGNPKKIINLEGMIALNYDVIDEGVYSTKYGDINYKIEIYYDEEFYFDVELVGNLILEHSEEFKLNVKRDYLLDDFRMDDRPTLDIFDILWQSISLEIPY